MADGLRYQHKIEWVEVGTELVIRIRGLGIAD
jgi:hypothetical protein